MPAAFRPTRSPASKQTPEYEAYPALGTYFYGLNLENLPDVHERRALSLAIDRRTIVDQIARPTRCRPPVLTGGAARVRHVQSELAVDT